MRYNRRLFAEMCGLAGASLGAASPAFAVTGQEEYLRRIDEGIAQGPFRDDWDSLTKYQVPRWYQDAKLGIFIHWGVYSVPAYMNEWYPRNMYLRSNPCYWHHLAKYGSQKKFGYKDFIPMFKAERFDPASWIGLFQKAGARYVVPVAEHHDGFAMYDCGFSEWTAAKMGPKRDVIADLMQAAAEKGMVFGASSHRAEHWWFFNGGRRFPSDVQDPRYASLYGPAMPQTTEPDKEFLDDWLVRTAEIIDNYRPKVLWFDWWIEQPAFEPYRRKLAAYYYNRAAEWGEEVALNYKNKSFPETAAVLDLERSQLAEIRPLLWQTDTTVSLMSWGYIEPKNEIYKSAERLVGDLVDIVSKNGVLLLNAGPAPDGTFPQQVIDSLEGIGKWLNKNGEAVYGTRPWKVFGEGPVSRGPNKTYVAGELAATPFTSRDVRFTVKGDKLYAIVMKRPPDNKVEIESLGSGKGLARGKISSVRLLENETPLTFEQKPGALRVILPEIDSGGFAVVLEIGGAA